MTDAPESVPPLSAMPSTARETQAPPLHTYKLMNVEKRPGYPLTFSDGERVIAVVGSQPPLTPGVGGSRLTVLVELP
jgi:hypothetical protein